MVEVFQLLLLDSVDFKVDPYPDKNVSGHKCILVLVNLLLPYNGHRLHNALLRA